MKGNGIVKKCIWILVVLVAAFLAVLAGDIALKTLSWAYDRAKLNAILKNEPAYSKIRIEMASIGYCYLCGEVETEEECARLFSSVSAAFPGDQQAEIRMHVRVRHAPAAPP